jgi:hypothetical protein
LSRIGVLFGEWPWAFTLKRLEGDELPPGS